MRKLAFGVALAAVVVFEPLIIASRVARAWLRSRRCSCPSCYRVPR